MNIVEIKYHNTVFEVEIIRSRRKTMALQAYKDGRIVARVPKWIPKREITRFLDEHTAWMENAQIKMTQKRKISEYEIPEYESLSRTQKNKIRSHFIERTKIYAMSMGVTYNQIFVKNQKSRWGSCSSLGNLNFNYRLYYLPQELMDYVIVHELAHRIHMNHSSQFWRVVEAYIPDYKGRRKRLHEIGIS